jgi:peptidoglycan/xylan/chitin deacetylase (PgdA/CDA1 family)
MALLNRSGYTSRTVRAPAFPRLSAGLRFFALLGGLLVGLAGCDSWQGHTGPRSEVVAPTPAAPVEPPKPPYEEISLASQSRRIPVIMYHDVVAERTARSQWFDCSAAEFQEQMALIASRGYVPISIQDLYDHLTGKREAPESAIVITFDDNYQGFYDHAWPVLKQYGFPSAVFVHTGFVGKAEGEHPKMTWDTLRELMKDPLFTVGSHTITHPDDISQLDPTTQEVELRDSKAELEQQLGKTIDCLAYPNGKNDEAVQALSKALGYKMAFSIENGLAEESPSIMAVHRYVHTRLEKAMEDRDRARLGGAGQIFRGPMSGGPITYVKQDFNGVKMSLISGGSPESVASDTREGVKEFVARTGAQAGINGTFFAMAAIKSTDNRLVGPCKTHDQSAVLGDEEQSRWPKLRNRPVMMWDGKEIAIVPYQPETMRYDSAFRDFMPDVTDVFMGGVWLVHQGVPLTRDGQSTFGSKDIQDARRRAFIGVDANGQIVLGASHESVSSEKLAIAAAEAGLMEAMLLDSGFSTSLVIGESILASGHSTPTTPSRPVPHAIVLRGALTPEAESLAKQEALPAPREPRRRRRN